ncbi:MAG: triose-phosphate isomerase [Synergistetes bacterium]|nr:triose-phosphate isomerase [Synergistota bacterium]
MVLRKPLIAGNWKMHKTNDEAEALAKEILSALGGVKEIEVAICPPFTALERVGRIIEGSEISLGAQNMFWEEEGAFTGEVSPKMLVSLECKYVILGHSERRKYFKESDDEIRKKFLKALEFDLIPILCVGENLEDRKAGKTWEVVDSQLTAVLKDVKLDDKEMVIAYEPVWAIGTGVSAKGEDALEVISSIRKRISELLGEDHASKTRILYGGSVKPDNIMEFMQYEDIDGALVGGASLKADSFTGIVKKILSEREWKA